MRGGVAERVRVDADPAGTTVPAAPPARRRAREVTRLSPPHPSGAIPRDVVLQSGRHLSFAILVVAAVDAIYCILYQTAWIDHAFLVVQLVGLSAFAMSLATAWWLRRRPRSQGEIMRVGFAYVALLTFGLSVSEYWALPPLVHTTNMISVSCLIIALFPVLVPAPAHHIAVGSMCAAATNPIAFAIVMTVDGRAMPAPEVVMSLLLPPFLAAVLALLPAVVFHRLQRQVSEARRVGSYSLVEKLGVGGMGEVWRGEHSLLARPAAIKLISAAALDGRGDDFRRRLVERFEREAQTTAALESPHTVELFDFGVTDDGAFYYVMELLRGIDLETLVKKFGPQPPERVAHILLQVCDSLDEAHASGLVHRDIKPANILLTARARSVDVVKVLDFGLVKLVEETPGDLKLSRTDEVHGTPAFMAPEEATGSSEVDARSDLYSLGCVAYWLLCGKLVFDETGAVAMALAHATREPIAVSRRAYQDVPPALEAVVMQCLEKSPADRPASAAELGRNLAARDWSSWSSARAQAWWREHLPDLLRIR